MAENSGIEWTTHTFNPIRGCQKVSEACRNCYAATRAGRFGEDFAHSRIMLSETEWKKPLTWNRKAECTCGGGFRGTHSPYCPQADRPRVFCASLGDVFEDWSGTPTSKRGNGILVCDECGRLHEETKENLGDVCQCGRLMQRMDWATLDDVRRRLFNLIDSTPNIDWLLLTKRPQNIGRMWPVVFDSNANAYGHKGAPHERYRPNVWLGTTIENQPAADERIPELLKCRSLSPVLFLSCEPLLGPIDPKLIGCPNCGRSEQPWFPNYSICRVCHKETKSPPDCTVDWVIAGGESGPNSRPSHPDWFRYLRDLCRDCEVPFFFKQWGDHRPWSEDGSDAGKPGAWINDEGKSFEKTDSLTQPGFQLMAKVGKKNAGRLLDGSLHNASPISNLRPAAGAESHD